MNDNNGYQGSDWMTAVLVGLGLPIDKVTEITQRFLLLNMFHLTLFFLEMMGSASWNIPSPPNEIKENVGLSDDALVDMAACFFLFLDEMTETEANQSMFEQLVSFSRRHNLIPSSPEVSVSLQQAVSTKRRAVLSAPLQNGFRLNAGQFVSLGRRMPATDWYQMVSAQEAAFMKFHLVALAQQYRESKPQESESAMIDRQPLYAEEPEHESIEME